MAKLLISQSKGKKAKSGRSAMLSDLMKGISGGDGEAVIAAYDKQDAQAFKKALAQVANKIAAKFPNKG